MSHKYYMELAFSRLDINMKPTLSPCRLNRASQTYFFPIHLTDQLMPSAVFYATVGPLVVYLALQQLIIRPYVRAQKEQ